MNNTKKIIIISSIVTTISIGFIIYKVIDRKRKEKIVNEKITSLDDALDILSEKENKSIDDSYTNEFMSSEDYVDYVDYVNYE